MNKVNWLTAAIAKFSPKPSNLVAKEIPADVAKPSSTRRNTAERLAATLKQQHEAMSPRLLRRSFQALQAVIDPSISEIEGGKRPATGNDLFSFNAGKKARLLAFNGRTVWYGQGKGRT